MAMQPAGEVGPCSAWPSRSVATSRGSAVSSAMTSTSVGPASRSIPTRPNSWRLASATNALPAPTSMSTGSRPSIRPNAIAARPCTPPRARTASAPEVLHRVQHRRVDPALALGRRAADHLPDARHLGHQHRHERRGEHRVAPAGHVGADRVDRDVAVAEHDARSHLDLERRQRAQLGRANPRTWSWAKAMCPLSVVVELGLDAARTPRRRRRSHRAPSRRTPPSSGAPRRSRPARCRAGSPRRGRAARRWPPSSAGWASLR